MLLLNSTSNIVLTHATWQNATLSPTLSHNVSGSPVYLFIILS
jgi:hypothetical protein